MHQIKPLASLSDAEITELACAAAERGECVSDVNPFTAGHARTLFEKAFRQRAADLQPLG